MTANVIPTWQVEQFSMNVEMLVQQTDSRLSGAVTVNGGYVGKQASPVDQIGQVEMQPVTSRFAAMGRVDAPTDRRWLFPSDYDLPQLVDSFDRLRLIHEPQNNLVQAAVAAANRKKDAVIYTAFFATAKTGEQGATSTTFPTSTSTNVVSVDEGGTASALNVAKLRKAKQLLRANYVDIENEQLYCLLPSADEAALLNEIQIVSLDFNDRPVLVDGRIQRFMGFNFIPYEPVTTGTDDQSGTSRQIPIWAKSGMHLGLWKDMQNAVTQREDLQGRPWQVYTTMSLGATRLQEPKVIKVWCR